MDRGSPGLPLRGRAALFGLLAAALMVLGIVGVGARPVLAGVAGQGAGVSHLLVADTGAEKLYVYRLPSLELVGQFDDLKLGAHAGVVALPDGRVLLVDDRNVEFVVLQTAATGAPSIVGRAKIPTPLPFGRAAWGAVDPALRYFAVSSDDADAANQTVTLLDLETLAVGQLQLALKKNSRGSYEEVHPYLAGSPLSLHVTAGEEMRSFAVADVMAGAAEPSGVVAIAPNPHGPVFSPELNRLYVTTAPGLAVLDLAGAQLQQPRNLPWEVGGVAVTQNFRPRLSYDGGYVYGAVFGVASPPLAPADWAEGQAYAHVADLRAETRGLIRLGRGIVGRFQLAEPYALFSNVHPDGDAALLLDIRPASPTFQQVVARVPLEKLANGPVAGQAPAGRESRSVAITPDGAWAFVSHGGDGRVSVIDTAARTVARTLDLPTPLKGGGYLAAVQLGSPLVDLMAR